MTRLKLLHVDRFTDATGTVRHYFRRRHGKRIPLPGLPGSQEFMTAYQEALAASTGKRAPAGLLRGPEGTFGHLTSLYYASPDYARLSPATRRNYRWAIDNLLQRQRIADRRVDQMRRVHVDAIVARLAATPA